MKGNIVFDVNQVIEVFELRAGGATYETIGKAMGCSGGFIAKVLSRENFGHLKIDPELEKLAKEAVIKRKPVVRGKKKAKASADPVKALTVYMKKATELDDAHEACLNAGLSDEAITGFYNAIISAKVGIISAEVGEEG
jgi:hypothetical protein